MSTFAHARRQVFAWRGLNINFTDFQENRPVVEVPDPITKTCLSNFDLIKPHFYIIKLGFTGVYIIFLISAQKHRLWVLVRAAYLLLYSTLFIEVTHLVI